MVRMFHTLLKARKGQLRIFEAVIATIIIFTVFSTSIFLIYPSRVWVLQEKADLDRLGYNLLHRLAESGTIENTVERYGPGFCEVHLKTVVYRSLPPLTYFNLTVFRCVKEADGVRVGLRYDTSVSNASPEVFAKSTEVSSTTMIYSSKQGNIYYLVLVLAREGEGGG